MRAIWKRELKSYFQTVTGWLFIAATLALFGLYFYVYNMYYGSTDISSTLSAVTFLFLVTVPILTMRTPVSYTHLFSLYLLGWKLGTLSYVIYLLIGLVGVPVFSGFTAGPAKLFGPTGGYLIGFIPMAIIAGIVIDKYTEKWLLCLLAMIVGTIVCYALGTAWLAYEAKMDMMAALLSLIHI